MRQSAIGIALAILWLGTSCSIGAPSTFTLRSASVDTTTYWCAVGSTNATYSVHLTIDAYNGTSNRVTITSVGAVMTLAAVKGGWLQHVGDKYDAYNDLFTPNAVSPGSSANLAVTVPSACTSGKVGSDSPSSADYSVTLTVMTSAGTYKVTTQNRHRIVAG